MNRNFRLKNNILPKRVLLPLLFEMSNERLSSMTEVHFLFQIGSFYTSVTMSALVNLCKCIFFLILLVLFVNMFGEPSLKRFFKEDVTKTISSEEVEGGMLLPAITLCPANNRTMTGWKDGRVKLQDGFEKFLEKECNSSTVEELFGCITEKTYTEEESILKTTVSTQ